MSEPTILCPKCKTVIKLTETISAPLIEATQKKYEKLLEEKDIIIAEREAILDEREANLKTKEESIDKKVSEIVNQERAKIVLEETQKAKVAVALDMGLKEKEVSALKEELELKNLKIAESSKIQATLIKEKRQFEDEKREFELTIEKRIQDELNEVRNKTRKEVEDGFKHKIMEQDYINSTLKKQVEDWKRKAEQGSQQLQGEVQELEIESSLKTKFPLDTIEPVPKGEYGGDTLQRVIEPSGKMCGTILWESKRTKNWSDNWLVKLRDDQRNAKAEISVLVTQVLPKGVEEFDCIDGVWVINPRIIIPVANMLRYSLIELSIVRQASEGQQTKKELIYSYLTGPRFRQRVQAIVESFTYMKEDLDREKKVITKQWAKRDEQIERVMQATVGMYGDMQGIAGKTLQEIEGLEMKALDSGDKS